MQMPSGMEMIEQEQEVLSEPESQDSVDSISGEVTRSWDPTAKDVRYTYARDRAVGFSEFWRPLKWSEEEWERRLLASGNLRKRGGLGIARHEKPPEPKPKPKAVPKEPEPEVEQLIAPEKPKKPRSQYPLATEVKPKFIDVPLSGLQGAAAEGAVQSMRKTAKKPVSPVLEDPDDELLNSRPAPREPVRAGEPLVPLGTVKPFSNERQTAPSFGHPTQPESFQMPSPVYTGGASPRTMLRPIMQEVQAPKRVPEEHDVGEYGDKPGRTWL
ncbi:unnamed protein product [Effrenium voratum]|uniref:Uncharacterized protein n=1 Tax=Effrenium voratum TaxID=2562239 RepID=A0AA36MSP2_9DINO|nr:unnamed protein product [Effrenium voratum]